jgi:hypothetical protein
MIPVFKCAKDLFGNEKRTHLGMDFGQVAIVSMIWF